MIGGFGSICFQIRNFFVRKFVEKLGMVNPLSFGLIVDVDKKAFSKSFI